VLDRDGTIIVDRDYLSDPDAVELLSGSVAGLLHYQALGFGLVIISNQSGVGRGYFDDACVERVHQRLLALLGAEGITIAGIYYCPHAPEERCPCRKPEPALLVRAASELDFDPAESIVIGDKPSDIELGRRVGAKTVLVRTGHGAKTEREAKIVADLCVDDLAAGSSLIILPK